MFDQSILSDLGIKDKNPGSTTGLEWGSTTDQGELQITSPTDGQRIASVYKASAADYERIVETAAAAFKVWRTTPRPNAGNWSVRSV